MGINNFILLSGSILGVSEHANTYIYTSTHGGYVGVAIICENAQYMRGERGNDPFLPCFFAARL